MPGMPMVYYGDEYAMPGANDPDCRRGMYWDEEYQDKEMYNWYKKLMQVRKTHACIVEGEMIETIANDDEDTIVMIRKMARRPSQCFSIVATVQRNLMSMPRNTIC